MSKKKYYYSPALDAQGSCFPYEPVYVDDPIFTGNKCYYSPTLDAQGRYPWRLIDEDDIEYERRAR